MNKSIFRGFDLYGIAVSLVCAAHCILTSTALAILPHYEGEIVKGDITHQLFAGFILLFCFLAIYQGYRKHKDVRVVGLLTLGLTIVIGATFFLPESYSEAYEAAILTVGSITLVTGHILNIRQMKCCGN